MTHVAAVPLPRLIPHACVKIHCGHTQRSLHRGPTPSTRVILFTSSRVAKVPIPWQSRAAVVIPVDIIFWTPYNPTDGKTTRRFRMRKIIRPFQTYFITTNIDSRFWIFVRRSSHQPRTSLCDIAIQNLDFYRKKFGFLLHGYVIMPDHVHLLLTVSRTGTISEIMRDWKHRIAFEMNRRSGWSGRVWQRDFWEHSIRNAPDFRQKMNYIHMNPVRAGLVEKAEDWPYSSAAWYRGKGGSIHIDPIS